MNLCNDIYLSTCNYNGIVRVDIRRFMGDVEVGGILPTIRDIYLSEDQWKVLRVNVKFVDYIIERAKQN